MGQSEPVNVPRIDKWGEDENRRTQGPVRTILCLFLCKESTKFGRRPKDIVSLISVFCVGPTVPAHPDGGRDRDKGERVTPTGRVLFGSGADPRKT